jgi:primosomal protein N' (replication factor Y) (superfamily II helicase)
LIADVVFDLPLHRPFSYLVPPGQRLSRGQRVSAPLHGRQRVGLVVELREGDAAGLKAIQRALEPVPILSTAALALGRWAAEESLSSLGSTVLSLLPPLPRAGSAEPVAPAAEPHRGAAPLPELWMGSQREARLAEALASGAEAALVIVPDRESAARWAKRLDAARLDSGAPDADRRAAWFAAARGRARVVVGTRSALLVPLPPPASVALLDEHDAAHKPPGAPRLHSRELLRERARLEGSRLLLLSPTPSVESWWRADSGRFLRAAPEPSPWPEILTADTRGILRHHPLTLPLTRAIEDMTRAGRRVALIVTRGAAALACGECGLLLRCPECGIALALSRDRKTLACRLCARSEPAPEVCPGCGGHVLSPFGWDPERVQTSVIKRFPRLRVSRDPRGAQVMVGTAALLRSAAPGSLGCAGFIQLDGLLRLPDFRAGERAWQLLWAAAEAVGPDGRVIVQTLHPEHYAVQAVRAQDRAGFYEHELRFRAELGYPPFRRLCVVSVRGRSEAGARALVTEAHGAVSGLGGLSVYPPAPLGAPGVKSSRWSFTIKGPAELPRLLAPALAPFVERGRRHGGVVEVEMDPVS